MKTATLSKLLHRLIFASVCLSLCMVLPFLTGQVPQIGNMLCPMHIPVLLSGFLCGPWWAMAVGAIAPLLRNLLFGMPYLIPKGLTMCFELCAYGLVAGMLYRVLPKSTGSIYASLIGAMLAGRIVWGIAAIFIYGAAGAPVTWAFFFGEAFVNAIPGIIVHLALIPVLVLALRRAQVLDS